MTNKLSFQDQIAKRLLLPIGAVLVLQCLVPIANGTWSSALARGGGGGGFRGGDFGGGMRAGDYGGYRGDYGDRGFDRGDMGRGYDNGYRPDIDNRSYANNVANRVPEQELRADANKTYNWGPDKSTLPTDGGFGRLASADMPQSGFSRYSPQDLQSRANQVRNDYGCSNGAFNGNYWRNHPGYWGPWANDWAWGGVGWGDLGGWWGMPYGYSLPEYDYGNNITYQNNEVYYGSQPVESATTYYDQAQSLADSAPVITNQASLQKKEWKALGVYSLVQSGQTNSTTMFQLAVNKQGIIRGAYYNALTGETKHVSGAVDKKRMRAAWTVEGNKNVVYDTGVANLLKGQSTVLVHLSKDDTQQWLLVKLDKQGKKAG
jgi:hypothetical protein